LKAATATVEEGKALVKKHGCLYSPPTCNSVIDDDLFGGVDPLTHIQNGCSKDVDVLIGSTYCEASMLWGMLPKTPVLHGVFASLFAAVLPRIVMPPAIRGLALRETKVIDTQMPDGALAQASWDLVEGFGEIAKQRMREQKDDGVSSCVMGTGENDGVMQATSYLFGTGGLASTGLVQALAKYRAPYVFELKMTDSESPKLRNGHIMDLPLLFTMDDEGEKEWMSQAIYGRKERGEGLDELAAGMQDCWAAFCRSGAPGTFNSMQWDAFPKGAVLASKQGRPCLQEVCKYAEHSPESQLWARTMRKNGIIPLNKGAKIGGGGRMKLMIGLGVVTVGVGVGITKYKSS